MEIEMYQLCSTDLTTFRRKPLDSFVPLAVPCAVRTWGCQWPISRCWPTCICTWAPTANATLWWFRAECVHEWRFVRRPFVDTIWRPPLTLSRRTVCNSCWPIRRWNDCVDWPVPIGCYRFRHDLPSAVAFRRVHRWAVHKRICWTLTVAQILTGSLASEWRQGTWLLFAVVPCNRERHRAAELVANRKWWTWCTVSSHCALARQRHWKAFGIVGSGLCC